MYQSTDRLVSSEQGVAKTGYQSVEGEGGSAGEGTDVSNIPETFLSQVKRAKQDSQGCCGFCLAFMGLLLGSILWTLVLIICVTVPVIMIVIGAEYFHDCPAEKMIPISLIVAGCVGMLSNIINFVDRFRRFADVGMPKRYTVVGWVNIFVNIFLLGWFIASCYWVYGTKPDFSDATKANFCNQTLYGFTYWILNFCFIFFGAMFIVSSIVLCIAVMCW